MARTDSSSTWALGLALWTLTGCAPLPDLDFEQCGNGLLEPSAGEDCDSREDGALGVDVRCGGSDDGAAACRYTCGGGARCPTGWACGPDEICRRPAPRFTLHPPGRVETRATYLEVVDLDADGLDDVVLHPDRRLSAHFCDGRGAFTDPFAVDIGRALGRATVVDGGEGPPAYIVPLAAGLHVLRASPERTLEGLAHAPYDLSGITEGPIRLVTVSRAGAVQDEVLLVLDGPRGLLVAAGFGDAAQIELPGVRLSRLASPPSVTDLEDLAPPRRTDEVLFAARGEERAYVVRVGCAIPHPLGFCDAQDLRLELRAELELPGTIDKGARFTDVDGDGRADVFASVRIDEVERLVWRPQRPDGSFAPAVLDDRVATACAGTCSQLWPIAAADLNQDGPADFVLREGILQTITSTPSASAPLAFGYVPAIGAVGLIEDAAIGDFNRDGRPDVAVTGSQAEGVELLLAGPRFIFGAFFEAVDGTPRHIAAGDFDGDLVDDLAVVVDAEDGSVVSVLYGQVQGPLLPPIEMGRFGYVQQMLAAVVLGADIGPVDTRWDLLLQTSEDRLGAGPESSAVLIGTGGRRMLAPYVLSTALESEAPVAVTSGGLDAAHPGADLLALTSSATWVVASSASPTYAAEAAARYDLGCAPAGWPDCALVTSAPDGAHAVAFAPAFPCVPSVSDAPSFAHVFTPRVAGAPACQRAAMPSSLAGPIAATWADVDPSPGPELLVAFHGLASARQSVAEKAGVQILAQGAGALEAPLATIEVPPGFGSVWGVATANLDDDVELEIVLLSDAGVHIADRGEGGWALGGPLDLGLPSAELLRALGAADTNQDGLTDLLIGTDEALHVALGVEARVNEALR